MDNNEAIEIIKECFDEKDIVFEPHITKVKCKIGLVTINVTLYHNLIDANINIKLRNRGMAELIILNYDLVKRHFEKDEFKKYIESKIIIATMINSLANKLDPDDEDKFLF